MAVKEIIAKLNKKYGDNTIGLASEVKYSNVPRLSSGSLFLDWALGKNGKTNENGWPLGRIIELYGPESSGKSLISLKTIVEAQKKGYDCLYLDLENTFDKAFAQFLGVDTDKLIISMESEGEKLLEMVCELLRESKNLKVVVFDSLAAMIPVAESDKDLSQILMAPMARLMSKGLRKLTASNKNQALIIFINQLRENPGSMYGNPQYTPGGRSLKFYSSVRVEVKKSWLLDPKNKKNHIGQEVKFKINKNKSDVPYKQGYFNFLYGQGIDKTDELISIGLLNETIERKGPYYKLNDKQWLGRDKMELDLKKDDKLFEYVRKSVFEGGD